MLMRGYESNYESMKIFQMKVSCRKTRKKLEKLREILMPIVENVLDS